jgi:monoamine oxidase
MALSSFAYLAVSALLLAGHSPHLFADASPTKPPGACRAPAGKSPATSTEVDVAIVGGGFSGMAAAYQLHQAGLKVVVMEATERLGGRSRSHPLETGPGLVELGATWINNKTQPNVTALAEEFGLELIEQYTEGYALREYVDGSVEYEGGDEDEEDAPEEELVSALSSA